MITISKTVRYWAIAAVGIDRGNAGKAGPQRGGFSCAGGRVSPPAPCRGMAGRKEAGLPISGQGVHSSFGTNWIMLCFSEPLARRGGMTWGMKCVVGTCC